jgi:hypothetical protein
LDILRVEGLAAWLKKVRRDEKAKQGCLEGDLEAVGHAPNWRMSFLPMSVCATTKVPTMGDCIGRGIVMTSFIALSVL